MDDSFSQLLDYPPPSYQEALGHRLAGSIDSGPPSRESRRRGSRNRASDAAETVPALSRNDVADAPAPEADRESTNDNSAQGTSGADRQPAQGILVTENAEGGTNTARGVIGQDANDMSDNGIPRPPSSLADVPGSRESQPQRRKTPRNVKQAERAKRSREITSSATASAGGIKLQENNQRPLEDVTLSAKPDSQTEDLVSPTQRQRYLSRSCGNLTAANHMTLPADVENAGNGLRRGRSSENLSRSTLSLPLGPRSLEVTASRLTVSSRVSARETSV